jgi:lysophospholipase L1-like esterase
LPDSKVLLLAIFPRQGKDSAGQLKVNEVNAAIAKLADDNTTFLDIGKHFLKPDGEIDKDLMPDLLHPNEKGYQVWYDAMWPTLEKMLK